MPTVNVTLTGAEPLTESNLSPNIDFAYGTSFSFQTLISDLVNEAEEAIQPAGLTWEAAGIPAGAIVTSVSAVYDRSINNSGGRVTDSTVVFRLVDNGGTFITTNPLISNTTRTTGSATGVAGTGDQPVLSSYQASNQGVRLYMMNTLSSNSSTINWNYSLDNIVLTITYELPAKGKQFFAS